MRSRWRSSTALREATSNLIVSPARALLLVLVWGGAVTGLMLAELHYSEGLIRLRASLLEHGSTVLVANPVSGPIDGARCAALANQHWVVAAGGSDSPDTVELVSGPGLQFQRASVSHGALTVWAGADAPSAADVTDAYVLGLQASRETGITPGMLLGVKDAPIRPVGAAVDLQSRRSLADRWIIESTAPSGTVDQCWVETIPGNENATPFAVEAWFAGTQVEVRPLFSQDQFTRDPVAEFAARPHRTAWLPVGALLALLAWTADWFRRSERGLYLALGFPRPMLMLMAQMETVIVGWIGLAAGSLWAVAVHSLQYGVPTSSQVVVALTTASMAALAGLVLSPLGSVLFTRDPIPSLLKDR